MLPTFGRSRKRPLITRFLKATRTGLEPATSGSTVRGSNQLSYRAWWLPDGWMANYIGRYDTRKSSRCCTRPLLAIVSITSLTARLARLPWPIPPPPPPSNAVA